jgi:hypothetical protein
LLALTLHCTAGYPLFLLLSRVSQLVVPFGSPAFQTTLVSCISGAVCVAFILLLCQRFYGHRECFVYRNSGGSVHHMREKKSLRKGTSLPPQAFLIEHGIVFKGTKQQLTSMISIEYTQIVTKM